MRNRKIKIGNNRSWRHFLNRKTTIVLIITLVAIAGTTLALTERLSNQVHASVTISDYPLKIEQSPHDMFNWTTGPLIFNDIHRLDNLIIDMNIQNQKTEPVTANLIIQINSDNGFTFNNDYDNYRCLDFDRLFLAGPDINLMDHLGAYSTNHTLFFEVPITVTNEGLYPWLDMTFSENASGSYEILVYAGYLDF